MNTQWLAVLVVGQAEEAACWSAAAFEVENLQLVEEPLLAAAAELVLQAVVGATY